MEQEQVILPPLHNNVKIIKVCPNKRIWIHTYLTQDNEKTEFAFNDKTKNDMSKQLQDIKYYNMQSERRQKKIENQMILNRFKSLQQKNDQTNYKYSFMNEKTFIKIVLLAIGFYESRQSNFRQFYEKRDYRDTEKMLYDYGMVSYVLKKCCFSEVINMKQDENNETTYQIFDYREFSRFVMERYCEYYGIKFNLMSLRK